MLAQLEMSAKQTKFVRVAKAIFAVRSLKGLTAEQRKARFSALQRVVRAVLKKRLTLAEGKRIAADLARGGVFEPSPVVKALAGRSHPAARFPHLRAPAGRSGGTALRAKDLRRR